MSKFSPAGHKNLDRDIARIKWRGESNTIRETGNKTIDLSAYRGNLYKQTLSPSWSKGKLREQKEKYEKIAEDARRSVNNSGLSDQRFSPLKSTQGGGDVSAREAFMDTRLG